MSAMVSSLENDKTLPTCLHFRCTSELEGGQNRWRPPAGWIIKLNGERHSLRVEEAARRLGLQLDGSDVDRAFTE